MDIIKDIKECDAFVFLTKVIGEMNDVYCDKTGLVPFSVRYFPDAGGVYFEVLYHGDELFNYPSTKDDTEVGRKVFLQNLEKELIDLFDRTEQSLKGQRCVKTFVKELNKKVA